MALQTEDPSDSSVSSARAIIRKLGEEPQNSPTASSHKIASALFLLLAGVPLLLLLQRKQRAGPAGHSIRRPYTFGRRVRRRYWFGSYALRLLV
jgi:hypothetical protein